MTFFRTLKELFKRYPLFRVFTWVVIIAVVLAVLSLFNARQKKTPVIQTITPPTGIPGESITIEGSNFGSQRDTSFVEIAGSRLTSSAYNQWTDSRIEVTLPSNVQDGLVYVVTSSGKSGAGFFANSSLIPVPLKADPTATRPVITSISPDTASVGETIVISGTNFGATRDTSLIYFYSSRENAASLTAQNKGKDDSESFIAAKATEYDYEYWSENEIRVRVPDGASSGPLYITTDKGKSSTTRLTVRHESGNKIYSSKRTYIIQLSADIATNIASQDSTITLYIPRPPVSSIQTQSDLTECYPEPLIKNDPKNIIYQRSLNNIINNKQRFNQNFVITVYSVNSNIKKENIKPYRDTKRVLYNAYTSADSLIQSDNTVIKELTDKIIGKEKNPYNQAKLIYDYLIDNYKIQSNTRAGDADPLDLILKKQGDAYDFAIIFTALCRSAGIPAIPMSGILVDNNVTSRNHWWTEIYFEDYGWFPVDTALGAGMEYKTFNQTVSPRDYYFGNLDSQHVALSRGWNQIRSSLADSKIVYRPRTYALQSIWEEAGSQTSSYSSLWNNPVIMGIY